MLPILSDSKLHIAFAIKEMVKIQGRKRNHENLRKDKEEVYWKDKEIKEISVGIKKLRKDKEIEVWVRNLRKDKETRECNHCQ